MQIFIVLIERVHPNRDHERRVKIAISACLRLEGGNKLPSVVNELGRGMRVHADGARFLATITLPPGPSLDCHTPISESQGESRQTGQVYLIRVERGEPVPNLLPKVRARRAVQALLDVHCHKQEVGVANLVERGEKVSLTRRPCLLGFGSAGHNRLNVESAHVALHQEIGSMRRARHFWMDEHPIPRAKQGLMKEEFQEGAAGLRVVRPKGGAHICVVRISDVVCPRLM